MDMDVEQKKQLQYSFIIHSKEYKTSQYGRILKFSDLLCYLKEQKQICLSSTLTSLTHTHTHTHTNYCYRVVTLEQVTHLRSANNKPILITMTTTFLFSCYQFSVFLIKFLPLQADGNRSNIIINAKKVLMIWRIQENTIHYYYYYCYYSDICNCSYSYFGIE